MFGVDAPEVLGQQRHAKSTPAILVSCAQQTKIIVRLVARMVLFKPVQEFTDAVSEWPHKLAQERRHALFALGRELVCRRRNPNRDGLKAATRKAARIAQCF